MEIGDKRCIKCAQGSVLGPILFLIFINDLERGIVSPVYKFADDTKLLGKVSSAEGRYLLQQDLQHLTDWSAKWQMPSARSCTLAEAMKNSSIL